MNFLSRTISSSRRRTLAVDLGPRVALEPHLLEQFPVLAFAPPHDRRHDHELGPLLQGHQPVDDLLLGLAGDLLAALGAVRHADPRPEQAQVVVDLGHRADRRARVARGRLLVDRDRRREPLDRVDVGLLHQAEELARVGGERLDVAALPLGVDRVEGEARLARAREPGDHDQRVARQLDVDALEVVLTGAGDDDSVRSGHCTPILRRRTDVPTGRIPPSSSLVVAMRDKPRTHHKLARLAARQHGVVSTRQLHELGYSRNTIARYVATGRLHRVHRGVYAVGHGALSKEGKCLAAVLSCGDDALLSHRSAAWLWGLASRWHLPIDVTRPARGQIGRSSACTARAR